MSQLTNSAQFESDITELISSLGKGGSIYTSPIADLFIRLAAVKPIVAVDFWGTLAGLDKARPPRSRTGASELLTNLEQLPVLPVLWSDDSAELVAAAAHSAGLILPEVRIFGPNYLMTSPTHSMASLKELGDISGSILIDDMPEMARFGKKGKYITVPVFSPLMAAEFAGSPRAASYLSALDATGITGTIKEILHL